jgi:NADH-quinone oxidoreductase subunit A
MGGMAAFASYLLLVIALVGFLLGITHILGERHRQPGTGFPYESGVLPTGTARVPFPADFYLVAMFFVIFDASSVFLLAWAVAARELGWAGYAAMLAFLLETLAALAYLWKSGAFDWGRRRGEEHLKRHALPPPARGGPP